MIGARVVLSFNQTLKLEPMRPATLFAIVSLFVFTSYAQDNNLIHTQVLGLDQMISYAADRPLLDSEQQLLFLFETPSNTVSRDAFFYMEQSLLLMLKRLKPTDQIGIATYGHHNRIVLEFTEVAQLNDVPKLLRQIENSKMSSGEDGIEMAYQYAERNRGHQGDHLVLMIRDNVSQKSSQLATRATNTRANVQEAATSATDSKGKIGGAIALTALSILPEILQVIKN